MVKVRSPSRQRACTEALRICSVSMHACVREHARQRSQSARVLRAFAPRKTNYASPHRDISVVHRQHRAQLPHSAGEISFANSPHRGHVGRARRTLRAGTERFAICGVSTRTLHARCDTVCKKTCQRCCRPDAASTEAFLRSRRCSECNGTCQFCAADPIARSSRASPSCSPTATH